MSSSGLQNIGLTALLTFQRALEVTAHNIANAGTPGYSHQSVDLSSRQGGLTPAGPIGSGVQLAQIRRGFDNLLFSQLIGTTSALGRNRVMAERSQLIDSLLGPNGFDLSGAINSLSARMQDLSTDPTSIAARTAVLADAGALANRFATLDIRFQELRTNSNNQLRAMTTEVNQLTAKIGDLNVRISQFNPASGDPNDLLDQRDQAVRRLSELLDISVHRVDGNIYNVSIANGQSLVVGGDVARMSAIPSEYDQTELVIALDFGSGPQVVDRLLTGGELAGTLGFLRDVLTPAQNEIGRLAMALASAVNAQHTRGLDLNGDLGLDLFTVAAPQLLPATTNSNLLTDTTAVVVEDIGAVTGDEYLLSFDGTSWRLENQRSGQVVPLVPAGSDFLADGLRISVDPGAAAGDSYLIRPTRGGARGLALAIDDPALLAAASALAVTPATGNGGNATSSPVEVVDPTDPNLLATVNITFISPTSYQVDGGPPQAYTPGADITVNGWRLQISGTPQGGDSFTIGSNQGATGNGENARLLGLVERLGVLDGGTLSVTDAHGRLISAVGSQVRSLEAASAIEGAMLADIDGRLQQVQGVNLDEEAIKLQQYQQAYSAAAELFSVAEEVFQTLLASVRR